LLNRGVEIVLDLVEFLRVETYEWEFKKFK